MKLRQKVALKMCKDPLNPSLDQADVAESVLPMLDDIVHETRF